MAIPKHLMEAKICNEKTCKLANTIPTNDDKNNMIAKLVAENANMQRKIIKAIEHLKIKQARLINEKDYVITDFDLDEIMQDLEKGE